MTEFLLVATFAKMQAVDGDSKVTVTPSVVAGGCKRLAHIGQWVDDVALNGVPSELVERGMQKKLQGPFADGNRA